MRRSRRWRRRRGRGRGRRRPPPPRTTSASASVRAAAAGRRRRRRSWARRARPHPASSASGRLPARTWCAARAALQPLRAGRGAACQERAVQLVGRLLQGPRRRPGRLCLAAGFIHACHVPGTYCSVQMLCSVARGRPPYPIYRRGHAAPQEELEEERAPPDAEALERRRLRDAEEWRLKQLRAGVSAADNSNFQARARRSVHRCGRCRKGAALCHVSGF